MLMPQTAIRLVGSAKKAQSSALPHFTSQTCFERNFGGENLGMSRKQENVIEGERFVGDTQHFWNPTKPAFYRRVPIM